MGGGKSRAVCEKALEYAMTCPGVEILVARQRHTSIIQTTEKTWKTEVCPSELVAHEKHSMGEDFWELHTPKQGVRSTVHFVGLEDPERWFSAQIGVLIVDQVEECEEEVILKLITRLRDPRAPVGDFRGERLAGKVILSFNPASPDHWLRQWFFDGANQTDFGFVKPELVVSEADAPIGDAEFFLAKATDNPHLAPGYVAQTLAALPPHLRRRYLEGIWEYITGQCYFDTAALDFHREQLEVPRVVGETTGSLVFDKENKIRVKADARGHGPLAVWRPPVREATDDAGRSTRGHRYVLAVDVSSGGSHDNSALQVIDVEEFAQVAEWQGKLDPDLVAVEAFRLGRIYNDALIVPEVTGGWGHTVVSKLEKLGYRKIYTRRVEDRLKKRWTDRLGWDTTARSRALMLDTLEEVLREREFTLRGHRTFNELTTFVRNEKGKPEAQSGCRDDLVVALAIGVLMASTMPKQLRRPVERRPEPQFAATGW